MVKKNTLLPTFPTSEYMLVLSPDAHLQERISRVREALAEKTGLSLPARKSHILLARWQSLNMQEDRLVQRLHVLAMEQYPFRVNLEGFSGIPSHTLCIQVPTREPVLKLVAAIRGNRRLMQSQETDPYFISEPSLPVARGLNPGSYEQAMLAFSARHFHASFIADSMLLLKRKPGTKGYQILSRFAFEHLAVTARQATLFA